MKKKLKFNFLDNVRVTSEFYQLKDKAGYVKSFDGKKFEVVFRVRDKDEVLINVKDWFLPSELKGVE